MSTYDMDIFQDNVAAGVTGCDVGHDRYSIHKGDFILEQAKVGGYWTELW